MIQSFFLDPQRRTPQHDHPKKYFFAQTTFSREIKNNEQTVQP